jgi:hypothetical protein
MGKGVLGVLLPRESALLRVWTPKTSSVSRRVTDENGSVGELFDLHGDPRTRRI